MNQKKLIWLIILFSVGMILLTGCVSNGIDEVAHYEISVRATQGGQVTVDPKKATYLKGEKVKITATSETDLSFKRWEGTITGTDNPVTITVSNNVDALAVFGGNPDAKFILTVKKAGSGTYEITPPKEEYQNGESVTITARPVDGWKFVKWDGDVRGTENPLTLTMDWSKTITAVFVEAGYADGIEFADPKLEMLIRNVISKPTGPICPEDVDQITDLDVAVEQIEDLGGIEYLTALSYLDLHFTNVSVLDPLAFLTELVYLDLSKGPGHTKISDITALSNLEKLVELNLSDNEVQDLGPLYWLGDSDHNVLTTLDLSKNRISDVAALRILFNLQQLNLAHNMITDIEPLTSLDYLTDLDLSFNEIEELSVLEIEGLRTLEKLNLGHNLLTDLKDLTWIWGRSLIELDLSSNDINDINDIYGFFDLQVLNLSNNRVTDLSVLYFLKDLRVLNLSNNLVEDITNLAEMKDLEYLYLNDNFLRNIETLLLLPNLKEVTLMNNPNLDFTPGSNDYDIITQLKNRGVNVLAY